MLSSVAVRCFEVWHGLVWLCSYCCSGCGTALPSSMFARGPKRPHLSRFKLQYAIKYRRHLSYVSSYTVLFALGGTAWGTARVTAAHEGHKMTSREYSDPRWRHSGAPIADAEGQACGTGALPVQSPIKGARSLFDGHLLQSCKRLRRGHTAFKICPSRASFDILA